MNPLFADAGYWIALLNPHDQLHAKAIVVGRQRKIGTLLRANRNIVTSQVVLTEFLNQYIVPKG